MKLFLGLVAVFAMLVTGSGVGYNYSAATVQEQTLDDQFLPIDNMHHFMKYISQPSYKTLKQALASEPENRRAWRPVNAGKELYGSLGHYDSAKQHGERRRIPERLYLV